MSKTANSCLVVLLVIVISTSNLIYTFAEVEISGNSTIDNPCKEW
ncbi:MAG: hypothetical protein ACR2F1_13815 [Nitrososphaeraceae archaeon]